MGKKLGSSFIGLPIWIITGLAIFVLFSAIYDFIVLDRSAMRYFLIGASALILLITISLKFVPLSFVARQSRRQLGA